MSNQAQAERLLADFPAHSYDQWHQAAEALLKGASFEKLLVSKTYEDITIQPIYRQEDIARLDHRKHFPGTDSLVRGSRADGFLAAGWDVSQQLVASSPQYLNRLIHEGLQGGQSELNISVATVGPCTPADEGRGLCLQSMADMQAAMDGVAIEAISTYWRSGANSTAVAALWFALARSRGLDTRTLRGCFDNDPYAELLENGGMDPTGRFDQIAALTAYAQSHAPNVRTLVVQGDVYHNAGASATQELGYVMATLVCYLEELAARGLSPASVLPHIRLRLAIGSDYFMEIAKIRAARILWSKVAAAYGVADAPVQIHASTSRWNKTCYDAHTNMLRVTAEAFAAVVAGVDSLHIGPYDEVTGRSDEFSRRIARNLHTILREECGLSRVIDPAGGSTYIEWLTDQVAGKSWQILQDIEARGGMLACLTRGEIQQAVEAICQTKLQNIRRRKDKIVGANMYPDLKGAKLAARPADPEDRCQPQPVPAAPAELAALKPVSNATMVEQAIAAALAGASAAQVATACTAPAAAAPLQVAALPARRAAGEYEALRDAAAAFAATTGAPPTILQLNIGPSRKYRLRADWTAAFFEAAGFAVAGARDFPTPEAAVQALVESPAMIAVITSDDATYQEVVVPLATAAKAAKPNITLLVAGAPGDHEQAWRAAGVDNFVNVRSNNYELNLQLLKSAGVL